MPWKCLGFWPQLFLSFTLELTFSKGYHGSYIPLGRDKTAKAIVCYVDTTMV